MAETGREIGKQSLRSLGRLEWNVHFKAARGFFVLHNHMELWYK